MIKIYIKLGKRELWVTLALVALIGGGILLYKNTFAQKDFEIVDQLSGNIFPSALLSLATSDADLLSPADSNYMGSSQYGGIGIRIRSVKKNTHVRIEWAETPFSKHTVSEFILPKKWTTYTLLPEIVWKYDALRNNNQPTPLSMVATVSVDNKTTKVKMRTFSMRSLNECLLGYFRPSSNNPNEFVNTNILFAAYVNEDNPLIDKILREALNSKIVNRFQGYQRDSAMVVKQVYALWNALQRRSFRYSSISKSSLGNQLIVSQRVRTFDDAINSSQINCVDGSVLFASLIRAINIDPILILIPGHMFVGFYTDKKHSNTMFFETTMIGNIDLNDYFPDENIDSTLQGKSQNEMSRIAFEKAIEFASQKFVADSSKIYKQHPGYMFLEISNEIRELVQPIGR